MQIKGIDHDLQKYDFIDHDGITEESFPTRESTLMALVEVDQEPTVTLSISAQKTPPLIPSNLLTPISALLDISNHRKLKT